MRIEQLNSNTSFFFGLNIFSMTNIGASKASDTVKAILYDCSTR